MNTMSVAMNAKSTIKEKISYGLVGYGQQFVWTFCAMFITMYYTNSVGIAAGAVGTMMLISRFLDGVSDVFCAWVFKKTHFKMGRIRPWFIISAPLLGISIIALLNVPAGFSDTQKLIYAFITYAFTAAISFTITNLAWTAILPLMSYDENDRVRISSLGMFFVMAAILTLNVLTPALLAIFGGTLELGAWSKLSIVYAVIVVITHLIGGFVIKEKEMPAEFMSGNKEKDKVKVPFKDVLRVVLSNKFTWVLLLIFTVYYIKSGSASVIAYYFMYIFGDFALANYGVANMIGTGANLVGILIAPFIVKRFGMKKTNITAIILYLIASLAILAVARNMVGFYALNALRQFFIAPINATIFVYVAELNDVITKKHNGMQVTEGVSMCSSVGTKLGTGLGSAFVGWIMGAIGLNFAEGVQTASVQSGIIGTMVLLPAIAMIIVLIMISVWRVNTSTQKATT